MGFFSSIFKRGLNRAVGIDIGSSAIKVVELAKKGDQIELVTYGLLETGPYGGREIGRVAPLTEERTVEAIKDVIRESRVATKDSGIAIPFRSSFMRLIDLPSVTENELEKMVPLEARKYVPVPIGEVTLDYALVPQIIPQIPGDLVDENQAVHVFLIAIHNDILARFKSITNSLALSNQFFEVEAYSAMRSSVSNSNEAIMLCDIGASSVKTYIAYKGFILSTHMVNVGSEDMTLSLSKSLGITIAEAEILKREKGLLGDEDVKKSFDSALGRILTDQSRIKEAFEQKYRTSVTKVVLVGGGSQLLGLQKRFEESLKVEIELGNSFASISMPAFLRETVTKIGPEFAVATGCALRAILGDR